MPIHLSNIMLTDKKTSKPTRIAALTDKQGAKKRMAQKSGEAI